AVSHRSVDLALCVGTESMSRNPVAAYTHRAGFRMGQVEFKDFLWEALLDPAANVTMGGTAENLARQYQITRVDVDAYAARSFDRAVAAQESGFLSGETGYGGPRRTDARRDRPLRDQRSVRRAGDGLRARARHRREQAQCERRRDRARASAGGNRSTPVRHLGARAQTIPHPIWDRLC